MGNTKKGRNEQNDGPKTKAPRHGEKPVAAKGELFGDGNGQKC
jgi:hypothetical protein